jgi:hypothetical protein
MNLKNSSGLFAAPHESGCRPSRRFQRLATSAAIGEQRTWLDVLLV